MGGLIVQKYLESYKAPAGVLMASMPPQGYLGSGLRWMKRHPWHFANRNYRQVVGLRQHPPTRTGAILFCTPRDSHILEYATRLQEESARAGVDGLLSCPGLNGLFAVEGVVVVGASLPG